MNLDMFKREGKYLMLALDQRGSFSKLAGSKDTNILISKKKQIIGALDDLYSGVLVDPRIGLPAYNEYGSNKPLLLCTEKTGYEEIGMDRKTEIEHRVKELKGMGAKGIKILLFFNPFGATAEEQYRTANQISIECQQENLPYFFEIVTYGQGENLVRQSVKYFLDRKFRADIFKIEYPGSEKECQKVTKMLGKTEWIMLTAGIDYDEFCRRLTVACKNGCSGFLAGRSVWQDLIGYTIEENEIGKMRDRFEKISKIAINS